MKGLRVALLFVLMLSVFLASCKKEELKSTVPTRETETAPETVTDTETVTKEVFSWYEYDLSEYMTMGEPMGVKAKFDDPKVCGEKEIDEAVFQVMLANASFKEKQGKAERYDKVKISFSMELDGKKLDSYSREEQEILIGLTGQEDMMFRMGEKLIGAKIGETRTMLYTYPETASYGEMSGKTVSCYAVVKALYDSEISECTDEFVQKLEGFDFKTVADFRESLKKDILEEKENRKIQAVWSAYCETVKILKYPEAELGAYLDSYKSYYLDLAEKMEMTLIEFLESYLGTDEESFMKEAEDYAKELVRNDMIFAGLVQKLEVTLSEEEYKKGIQEYYEGEAGSFASLEEFVDYYSEENLRQNLTWDKALNIVMENAIAIQ